MKRNPVPPSNVMIPAGRRGVPNPRGHAATMLLQVRPCRYAFAHARPIGRMDMSNAAATMLLLQWSKPFQNGAPIEAYYIQGRLGPDSPWLNVAKVCASCVPRQTACSSWNQWNDLPLDASRRCGR